MKIRQAMSWEWDAIAGIAAAAGVLGGLITIGIARQGHHRSCPGGCCTPVSWSMAAWCRWLQIDVQFQSKLIDVKL